MLSRIVTYYNTKIYKKPHFHLELVNVEFSKLCIDFIPYLRAKFYNRF